ncbi:MAG: hypothetical protein WDN45_17800 [Caulobacteraceae bacterium]
MPRPQSLVDMLLKKDHGQAYDEAEYDRVIHDAVTAVVKRQVEAGVDVPSDGEASKVSYSTYMMDRLTGFGGDNQRKVALDLAPYPAFREKMSRMTGVQEFRRASCIGPVAVKDLGPLKTDIDNMLAAMTAAGVTEGFMNSASPGLITAFQPNAYYATHEDYVWALSDAMKQEYRMIVEAGPDPAARLPGPGHGPSHRLPGPERSGVHQAGRTARGGDERGAGGHRGRTRADARLLGQLRGPARLRHRPDQDPAGDPEGQAGRGCCSRRPIRATSTSGRCGPRPSCRRTRC